jgi:peptidoglycan/xylan/chitin deacetylase (PgdA/CDA1 family)
VTDPSWFAETLDVLSGAGFRAIDLDSWVARGRPAVERGFALAFDDGLRSIVQAAPLLARHQVSATVFLVTGRMGSDNDWPGQPAAVPREPLLDWSDLEALHAAGFQFAAHGRTHARLDRCAPAVLEAELRGSRDDIEQRLGRACRLLAYPYGASSPRVRRAAARSFAAAFGTRLDYATSAQDAHHLARIDACYLRSERALAALVADRWRGWLGVRRTLRQARSARRFSLLSLRGEERIT